jgi:hypothetical protein
MKMTKKRSMKRLIGSQKNVLRGVRYKRLFTVEGWRLEWRRVLRFRMERMVEKNIYGMT